MSTTCPDVVIIGGGVMGSSTAYHLALSGQCQVTVVERDPTYTRASSALSTSAIRQQFSNSVNIQLSRFGFEFLLEADDLLAVDGEKAAVGLKQGAYLYLASAAGEAVLRQNHALQRDEGNEVALLTPDEIQARFPWMATAGVVAGSLGLAREGWFDGPALLHSFRRKARDLGVTYVKAEAVGFERDGSRISAVRLADGGRIGCGTAVNAAGPYARHVAGWAGVTVPIEARRRSVFVVTCPEALPGCPLVIDPSGVWFRADGQRFLCGWSPPEEDDPERLPLDVDHAQFEDVVWPAMAERVPAFERLRLSSSWAGHYDYNTMDQNALIGTVPAVPNLVFINGFSGHGMQHSPGAGRAVSELILHGRYTTLDLSSLDVNRVAAGRPMRELNII